MQRNVSEIDRTQLKVPKTDEEHRVITNQRRIHLINKQFSKGLNTAEEAELAQLQAEMDSYIDSTHPLPTQALKELRDSAR
jgi:hypothetical protein